MRRVAASLLAVLPVLWASSCLDPTQITVRVLTDFECEPAMATRVQAGDSLVERTGCAGPREVGTAVIVPSGRDGRFVVRVTANTSFGPIEATRSIGHVPHAKLQLPITLHAACAGQKCKEGDTCVVNEGRAQCVSEAVDPEACAPPRICDETLLDAGTPTPPTSRDAGSDAADGGPPPVLDGGKDAGQTCAITPTQSGTKVPFEVWTFDAKSLVGSLNGFGANSVPLGCTAYAPGPFVACGQALDLRLCGASTQVLETQLPSAPNFEVGMRVLVSAPTSVVIRHMTPNDRGWRVEAMAGGKLNVAFSGTYETLVPSLPWTADKWFELHLWCEASTCGASVDGVPGQPTQRPPLVAPTGGTLSVGGSTMVDEVSIFDLP